MIFGAWPEELHFEPEQLLRIERARRIPSDDVHIDVRTMSGHITGSKKPNSNDRHIYDVNVYGCTCGDFIANKLPCKHMYRIAIECGLINSYSKEQFREAIGAIENLTDEAQQFLKAVLAVVTPANYGVFWAECDEKSKYITKTSWRADNYSPVPMEWLSSNPYLDIVPVDWPMLSIKEITDILAANKISLPDELDGTDVKDDLVKWIKREAKNNTQYLPNRFYVYAIFHQKIMAQALVYLRRKYDLSTYTFSKGSRGLKVQYPSGAVFEKPITTLFGDGVNKGETNRAKCHFPDDDITELLTLHGHNRCQNGFYAVAKELIAR